MNPSFPSYVLPFGVFSLGDGERRLGVAVEDNILDLNALAQSGQVSSVDPAVLSTGRLNELLAAGRPAWTELRAELRALVESGAAADHYVTNADVAMHLAWDVGDYVDFYASRHHAENVGRLFRPDAEPLLENWLHLPVGYHGRSGTVVVDGTEVARPSGQKKEVSGDISYAPTQQLDFELELGFVLGGHSELGRTIAIDDVGDHLFGVVLLNDWSARDIQAWEYVPLGPFLGKSFATSVSSWVVPFDALESARVAGPLQQPAPMTHLFTKDPWALDVDLEVWVRRAGEREAQRLTTVNAAEGLYWTAAQMIAHMTSNGATVRPGDLCGSGTISGPGADQLGSLLEMSGNGSGFLQDGDDVTLVGVANGAQGPIPLGSVTGQIMEA